MWPTFRRTATLTLATAVGLVLTASAATATARTDLPAPTRTNPVTGNATADPSGENPPVLVGVRTGRHAAYDRTVFDFTGGTPGYRVEYGKLYEEGRGTLIPLAGSAPLHVRFTGAYAHDPQTGAATMDLRRVINPKLPTLRQIRFGGDFEGYVTAGLGLADRVGFRVFTLTGPPRVVVDVAHQPTQPFRTATVRRDGTAPEIIVDRVRSGRHPGYDRLVFDLSGTGSPTLRARYVSGSTIEILFTATGSATVSPHATFAGPQTIHFGLPELRGVSFTVLGAGLMTARVTTTHRSGFRVMVLSAPTRVALDVAYP
jgi:hypothetical protein